LLLESLREKKAFAEVRGLITAPALESEEEEDDEEEDEEYASPDIEQGLFSFDM
jgi:hypothetical protein